MHKNTVDDISQAKRKAIDTHSEVRPKATAGVNKFGGTVTLLPYGVVDNRNHKDPYEIKEHMEEYANFDKKSMFASSLDDHDKLYIENESQKDKMASSLAGWY